MAEPIKIEEEDVPEGYPKTVADGLRRILMAGLGSLNLRQGEVEAFINRLADRGEIGENEARKLINEFLQNRKKQAEATTNWMEAEFEKRMEKLLAHMNVPTKSDIDLLMDKVSELSDKLDKLQETQTSQKD